MNRRALVNAIVLGNIAQLAMVLSGHFIPFIKDNVFAVGGMVISLVAGLLYARAARGGWGDSLLGGAISGGVCALVGIAISFSLNDVTADILLLGTVASTVTGLIGGAVGKLMK